MASPSCLTQEAGTGPTGAVPAFPKEIEKAQYFRVDSAAAEDVAKATAITAVELDDPTLTMGGAEHYSAAAPYYRLMVADWDVDVQRQARMIRRLIENYFGKSSRKDILDPTCGIGTQVLGLPQFGYEVTGRDICAAAVELAVAAARKRNVHLDLAVDDVRELRSLGEKRFDVAISLGNSLCALQDGDDVNRALQTICHKLQPGGLFIGGLRDYDRALVERPRRADKPVLCTDTGGSRSCQQFWEWVDDRNYIAHIYIDRENCETVHFSIPCRTVLRREVTSALRDAGLANIVWFANRDSQSIDQWIVVGRVTRAHNSTIVQPHRNIGPEIPRAARLNHAVQTSEN